MDLNEYLMFRNFKSFYKINLYIQQHRTYELVNFSHVYRTNYKLYEFRCHLLIWMLVFCTIKQLFHTFCYNSTHCLKDIIITRIWLFVILIIKLKLKSNLIKFFLISHIKAIGCYWHLKRDFEWEFQNFWKLKIHSIKDKKINDKEMKKNGLIIK